MIFQDPRTNFGKHYAHLNSAGQSQYHESFTYKLCFFIARLPKNSNVEKLTSIQESTLAKNPKATHSAVGVKPLQAPIMRFTIIVLVHVSLFLCSALIFLICLISFRLNAHPDRTLWIYQDWDGHKQYAGLWLHFYFFIFMSVCLSTWLSILTYLSFIMILLYFGIFCGVFVVAKYIFWLN